VAHVGKIYRLHFRRDLSLQVSNNRNGLSFEYDVELIGVTGSIGSTLNTRTIRLHQTGPLDGSVAFWTSGDFVNTGHLLRYDLHTVLNGAHTGINIRLVITDSALGKIWEQEGSLTHQPDYAAWSASAGDIVFQHPPQMTQAPSGGFMTIVAVRWGD